MLEYEWGNPSTIMLTGDDDNTTTTTTTQDNDQHRHHHHHQQLFDPYNTAPTHQTGFQCETTSLIHPTAHFNTAPHFHHSHPQTHNTLFPSLYDPRAAAYASHASNSFPLHAHHHHGHNSASPSMLSLEPGSSSGFMMLHPKPEPVVGIQDFGGSSGGGGAAAASRIGLNLGGRTYFASSEDDFVSRLYRRSRAAETGSVNSPRCQAEGCNADLAHAKHYHRRHKVCEFHSKASTVIAAGLTQRFCQQCSRFHILSEFDNGKRSCRKRLADHNRRRRKSQQTNPENGTKSELENARNSSSENLTRSPPDSGAHSSSVTVAISPPRISLDCFRQRSFQTAAATTSSASTSSLFFSNG